jgi:hypothetical protein
MRDLFDEAMRTPGRSAPAPRRATAQTLAERFGFRDPELTTPAHDEIMLWLDEHATELLRAIEPAPAGPSDDDVAGCQKKAWGMACQFWSQRSWQNLRVWGLDDAHHWWGVNWATRESDTEPLEGARAAATAVYGKRVTRVLDLLQKLAGYTRLVPLNEGRLWFQQQQEPPERYQGDQDRLREWFSQGPAEEWGQVLEILTGRIKPPDGVRKPYLGGVTDFSRTLAWSGLASPEERSEPMNVVKTWESVIARPGGYTVGFVDLLIQGSYSVPELGHDEIGMPCWQWRDVPITPLACEVKPTTPSLGELIRQLRLYQQHLPGAQQVVVSPDTRWVEPLRSQGFRFVRYQPGSPPEVLA